MLRSTSLALARLLSLRLTCSLSSADIAYALPQPCRTFAYNLVKKTGYGKKMEQAFNPLPMTDDHVNWLLDRFKEGNDQLASFLDVDLSHWNKPPKKQKGQQAK